MLKTRYRHLVSRCHGIITKEIDSQRLKELWPRKDLSIMDIAWEVDAFHAEVLDAAKKLNLGPRPCVKNKREPDPSQDEIYERAEHIRKTRWTKKEQKLRCQLPGQARWRVPCVNL
jgi:hypothetical protein